jgi:hypothetical protein
LDDGIGEAAANAARGEAGSGECPSFLDQCYAMEQSKYFNEERKDASRPKLIVVMVVLSVTSAVAAGRER